MGSRAQVAPKWKHKSFLTFSLSLPFIIAPLGHSPGETAPQQLLGCPVEQQSPRRAPAATISLPLTSHTLPNIHKNAFHPRPTLGNLTLFLVLPPPVPSTQRQQWKENVLPKRTSRCFPSGFAQAAVPFSPVNPSFQGFYSFQILPH